MLASAIALVGDNGYGYLIDVSLALMLMGQIK